MKAGIFTSMILMLTTFCAAQDHGFLEFNGSIDYGYRLHFSDADNSIFQTDNKEVPKFGYRLGLAYNLPVKENLVLKAGARFVTARYKTKEVQILGIPMPETFRSIIAYDYLEVPLAVRLEKPVKKWKSFWELGLTPSMYLETTQKLYRNGEEGTYTTKESKEVVNQFALGGYVSHGILYKIHEIVQIYGALALRMNFSPTLDNGIAKEYLMNAGFEMGVQLGL
ncbi:MAG: outer membrane beta-barrel protein [Saprospiraceae bacterium]|nr:outer membrane beta-barrel protein [Saprospiraceae bacterium]